MEKTKIDIPSLKLALPERCCAHCKFVFHFKPPGVVNGIQLMCKWGPPAVVMGMTANGPICQTLDPPVNPEYWCHRYEPSVAYQDELAQRP